jgi:hypothetical protein
LREQSRRQRWRALRSLEGQQAPRRIALVRHAARAARRAFGHFADLRLHQQGYVTRDLSGGAGEDGGFRAEARDCVTRAVPGHRRTGEAQLLCQRSLDRAGLTSVGRERSSGSAELQHAGGLGRLAELRQRARKRREPERRLQAEWCRQRRLQKGARSARRVLVAARKRGGRVA